MKASEFQMVLDVVKLWWLVCFQTRLVNGKHALCDGSDMSRDRYEAELYCCKYCSKWEPRSSSSRMTTFLNQLHEYVIDDGQ